MSEHEHTPEDENEEKVTDLDVPDAQASDVHGGLTEGEPKPTESISLNFKK